ncbi:MAG: AAA family ATPase [Candidatus Omnitrophota bacterium]|jgi:general secretion pathway protein A
MYEKFFCFKDKPFNVTPNPKFFFPSSKHTEALNSLIYAIEERKGFVVITGEIGAGKTTVTRTLLNKLDSNTKVALITNTHLTARDLIAQILEELEIEHKAGNKQKMLSLLNDYLIKQLAENTNVVLIIDEAQNLSHNVLEEVRMLSNLETETDKLLQIILIGQPELKKKLGHKKLEQFRQRIALHYHIFPLTQEETTAYVLHRLALVSSNGHAEIFQPQALNLIYRHSRGVPRIINLICDSALLSGYISDTKIINEGMVIEVIKDRELVQEQNDINGTFVIGNKKTHCCTHCMHYNDCGLKWDRGTKGQEQLCCNSCYNYLTCLQHSIML